MIVPIFAELAPLLFVSCAVAMVVLRAGASRVFFDIVGSFQASRLIHDAEAASVAMQALFIDGLAGIEEAASEINEQFEQLNDTLMPLGRNVAKARVEFAKFFDEGGQAAAAATEVIALGESYGFVAESALEAGSRVAQLRTIYGDAAIAPTVEAGIAFGMIGEMEAADAQRKLISLMQQNNIVLKDMTLQQYNNLTASEKQAHMTKVLSKALNDLNSIEDTSAARMSEIVDAMNEFGGAARLAGEDIDFMAAMTATLIERGITAEKTGTALRFVYGRVGGNISGAADHLRQYGVESQNADGSLRSMEQILGDLSKVWNQISKDEQRAISQSIAGNRHFSRISLLMNDYSRVLELVGNAQAGLGKVMEETGEATGYLADRLEDTAVQMDITQAKIDNVQAALGERLLPAQLNAMKAQLALNEAMMGWARGLATVPGLGNLTNELLEAREIISTMFAPYFTALINIQSMVLSLQLVRQIQRSLNGTQIAYIKEYSGMQDKVTLTQKEQLNLSNQQNIKASIRYQRQRIAGAMERGQLRKKGGLMRKLNSLEEEADVYRREAIRLNNIRIKEIEAMNRLSARSRDISREEVEVMKIKNTLQDAQNTKLGGEHWLKQQIYNISALSMAGATFGLMIFGMELNKLLPKVIQFENEADLMAASMMLMAGSMIAAVLPMAEIWKWVTADTVAMSTNNVVSAFKTELNLARAASEGAVAGATAANTGTTALNSGAIISNMLAGIGWLVQHTLIILSKLADISATIFLTVVKGALNMVYIAMTTILVTQNRAVAINTAKMWLNVAASTASSLAQAALTFITGAATFTWGSFTVAVVAATKALLVFLALTGVGLALIAIAAAAIYAAKKLGLFNNEMEETNDYMADMDYNASQFSFGDEYAQQMGLATDANAAFNNSREELFFGFKAGNIQGALIKQIEQQGVENFIVNTEVIQTNNFNGLTTDAVATQILNAIDKEASSRGINVTLAG